MFRLQLNGTWGLNWCEPGQGEARGWPETGPPERVGARVPGDVHLDLLEAGLIEEPLYGLNAPECRWMEAKDWWYSHSFHAPAACLGRRVEILFEGLDTTADVWLNGRHLGRTNNMLVEHSLDATDTVRPGRNLLVVRLDGGIRAADGKNWEKYRMVDPPGHPPRAWIRKAQFTFGWDWAPRLVTCGIWREVELRSWQTAALRDVCLRTHLLDDGSARVEVLAEVENFTQDIIGVEVEVELCRGTSHTVRLSHDAPPGASEASGELNLEDPELWWPQPLGEPALYDVEAVLSCDDEELDRRELRYGIREVSLLQEELGEEGTSFTLAVNGEPVYCKGAAWVPADSIIARVGPARYRALVAAAAEANFNMLRLWGGGIYEDDLFYELCDEHGILVWQDFMYACCYYPDDDPEFVAAAREEAQKAVTRLRNHPCLAVWCGNNENQWIHATRDTAARPPRCYGDRLYQEVLPAVCAELDPTRPYWPGSPFGGEDPNSPWQGNRHAWQVTIHADTPEKKVDYTRYGEDRGKFISEFGILAPPGLEALRRYLPCGEQNRDSPSWDFHNNRFEQGTNQEALRRYWRPAEELSLEEYVRYSQLIQAEGLKYALEHWRRRKFRTSGTTFWMFADCWGEVGWTIVDYYLNRKASYWAVRRAFAPVLVSLEEAPDRLSVWIVNDLRRPVPGRLQWGWANVRTGEVTENSRGVQANASEAQILEELQLPDGERDPWLAYARLSRDGETLSFNRHFLAGFHFNRVGIPPVKLDWRVVPSGDAVEVGADGFAWQVRLAAPCGVTLEDNHFDLLPGRKRRIGVSGAAGLVEQIRVSALNSTESRR